MSRCIKADQHDGSSVILGSYATLEECEQNCNCVIFSACEHPENPGQYFCPPGCILDYYEFAPSNCICCNGIVGCVCQDDSECGEGLKCCEGECVTPIDGWQQLGYASAQECYDSDPGAPASCDAPVCPTV